MIRDKRKEGREVSVVERIQIDTASIPGSARDNLAAATLECFKAFVQIPGNAEWLDQRIAARKVAAAQKKGADTNGILLDLP